MALTTLAKVRSWVGKDTADTAQDAEITRCIGAVEALLPRITNRIYAQTPYTRYFDGSRNNRSVFLPVNHRPVIHTGGTLVAVTESGATLAVAEGFSLTADVL